MGQGDFLDNFLFDLLVVEAVLLDGLDAEVAEQPEGIFEIVELGVGGMDGVPVRK